MIAIPDALWERLLDEIARTVSGVERVAYLDGFRAGEALIVTTLTIPDAELNPGFFTVGAGSMSQAGRHFRQFGMSRLAQVHTHGGAGCRHSQYDDEHPYSQRAGAISIVLPNHATERPGPLDGIVHIREGDGWVALTTEDAARLIRVVPSLLDFRSQKWIASKPGTLGRLMTNCATWISQIRSRSRSSFPRN